MLIYVIKSFLGILATWTFFKTLSVLLFPDTHSTLSFGRLLRAMVAACFAKPGACVRGLPELTYVLLGDVGILRGRYLLLQMGGDGEVLAGKDEAGGKCTLLMEHHWAEKLRVGGGGGVWYVLVKEPFVKPKDDSKDIPREWVVRVRHRSDWDILSSTSPLLPEPFQAAQTWREMTRSELKESGNSFYLQGVYWSAIELYKQALSRPVDTVPSDLLFRNSAQAELKLGLHDAAIRDATAAVAENPKDPKNFLKLAQCHYTVRSYALAEGHLNALLALDPLNVTGKLLLEKCKERIAESRGEFDFARIRKVLKARPKTFLDIADYIGPLKVVSGGYGKGLYTIRDIKAGELLLVSKALQFIYLSSGDLENQEKLFKMKEDCIAEVAERLNNERKLETAFFELWTGKEGVEPKVVDGGYVLDSDVIRLIYDVNCFTPSYFDKASFSESPPYGEGIWYLPAFMNHACWANTRRSFLGDAMILRAASDIPSNSQLFTPYISLNVDLPTRQAHLRDRYGFTCTCAYCTAQSKEPLQVRKSRESIIETLASTLTTLGPEAQQAALHAAIEKVEATYSLPPTEFPRLELLDVYWGLAMTYHHDQPLVGIDVSMKLLHALGFEFDAQGTPTRLGYVNTHAMPTMYQLCISWGVLGDEAKSKRWRENAKMICGILREDESRFEEIYTDWSVAP